AKPTAVDGTAIRPSAGKSKALHHARKVGDVDAAVRDSEVATVRTSLQRIGPGSRVLEIVNIVAELPQAERVLQVIPCDAAQRMLSDQASDDDTQPPVQATPSLLHRDAVSTSRSSTRDESKYSSAILRAAMEWRR